MTIRPTRREDIAPLQKVLDETGLFPGEMLPGMLSGFLSDDEGADIWLTCEADGEAVGFCNARPEELAEGTWNMLAIAVLPVAQGHGHGAALVQHLETMLRQDGQRIIIIDTSGTDMFAGARAFYRRNGYDEEARIRDFWAAGDDKVIFRKSLL